MVRFQSFDIVASVYAALWRIAKVEFARDGSVYVYFPGFIDSSGIVCRAALRAGVSGATTLDLKENGRVTSHLVKYAHHPDGRAHFSQTGKVRTEIRRQAVPLRQHQGHLFTIQVQHIQSFPLLPAPRAAQLTVNLTDSIRSLKITGWRHRVNDLTAPADAAPGAYPRGVQGPDGAIRLGLFVAPPEGMPFDDVVLFLAFEETPWLSEDRAAHLIFLGGFDSTQTALNHSVDTEFLAFAYPCSDAAQLSQSIGSIDLRPTSATDGAS